MVGRILVIEDHPPNLELMTYLLTAFGYTTLEAPDGTSGVAIANREKPDLIICDIQLPDISGYEIALRLKQDAGMRDTPLIAITALAMVGQRERILQSGFDGYISKPIAPQTFVTDVERFLKPAQRAGGRGWAAAAAKENGGTVPEPKVTPPAVRATILVVDNVEANLDLARSIFEPSGYRVLLAGDVDTAMVLARGSRPDIVLSDVNMPAGSGLELVLRIKSDPKLAQTPIVLISATMPSDTRTDLVLAAGAAKFLRRPIDPAALVQEIDGCLDRSRGNQERRREPAKQGS